MAISKIVYKSSAEATPVTWMDATPATAAAADITALKTAMLADGVLTTGTGSGAGVYQEKTVFPDESTQVITADAEFEYLVNANPAYMVVNESNYWQIPIIWQVEPTIGETLHVHFYWDRIGASYIYEFDGDVVWAGYGSTSFTSLTGNGVTITIGQNYAVSSRTKTSDDYGLYLCILQITKPASYDALSKVTVLGRYGYTLLASKEYTINTSSTTATLVDTISLGTIAWTKDKIIYVRVRDKVGKRAGYFYGSDVFFLNVNAANNSTSSLAMTNMPKVSLSYSASDSWALYTGTSCYGIYGNSISSGGGIAIYRRYSSSYSLTINGTYTCEVYALDWPDGISPFNAGVAT